MPVTFAPALRPAPPEYGKRRPDAGPLAEWIRKAEPIDRAVRDYVASGRPRADYHAVFLECMQLVEWSASSIGRRYQLPRDELVSAGTLGLAEGLERFELREGIPPTAYLRKRVRGAMLNLLKRESRFHEDSVDLLADAASGPEAVAAQSEAMRLVFGTSALGQREKEILYLNFFSDATQAEIARGFGLKQPAVCKIIAKALRRIRAALEHCQEASIRKQ